MIGDLAGIATAIGVLLAAAGLFAQTHQRKFGIAQLYIERYWQVDEAFLAERRPHADSADARRYLRLCEDEYDVARLGWIDVGVWRIWHDGIRDQVRRLQLDVRTYDHLTACLADDHHSATTCPGVAGHGWRRKLTWWVESAFTERA